jgi:hypothetical protein
VTTHVWGCRTVGFSFESMSPSLNLAMRLIALPVQ